MSPIARIAPDPCLAPADHENYLALYTGARHVTLASWVLVALLLVLLGGGLLFRSALTFLALLAALWGFHCYYRYRAGMRRAAVALGVLTLLMASGAAAGAISQLGLAMGLPFIDPWLAAADRILGFSSPAVVTWITEWPHLPELLGLAYVSSFPLLFGTALLLALRGSEKEAWELSFAFATAIVLSACCAALFPAEGAFPYLRIGPEIAGSLPQGSGVYHLQALDYFRNSPSITMDLMKLQGVVTFPSFHTSLALMTAFAWRRQKWIFYPVAAWNVIVIISTIPIGGHYGVDLLGGALLWVAVVWSASQLVKHPGTSLTVSPRQQRHSGVGDDKAGLPQLG